MPGWFVVIVVCAGCAGVVITVVCAGTAGVLTTVVVDGAGCAWAFAESAVCCAASAAGTVVRASAVAPARRKLRMVLLHLFARPPGKRLPATAGSAQPQRAGLRGVSPFPSCSQ